MEPTEELYCICRTQYNQHRFMIECYACKGWFHGDCVGISEKEADNIEEFHCSVCQDTHGPPRLKGKAEWKSCKPEDFELIEHPAIKNFYQALDDSSFLDSSHVVTYLMSGHAFTPDFVHDHTLQKPIVIEKVEGLGLVVPPLTCGKHLESYLGAHHVLNMHDILEHEERMVRLSEWTAHFDSRDSEENISIVDRVDITGTKLMRLLKPPRVLRQFDLVESAWPKSDSNTEDFLFEKPKQSLFLSMGDAGSFVDFQMGMVGAAVWFYNISGSRTFYLVPPTEDNLKIFEERAKINCLDNRFFGDLANACYKLVTREGEFVIVPAGWMVASYLNTQGISLIGEFCNVFSLHEHILCYELQRKLKSLNTLRYPRFEVLVWCAAELVQRLLSNSPPKDTPPSCKGVVDSARGLVTFLRKWISKKEEHLHAQEIPPHINPQKLINSISYCINKANRSSTPRVSPVKIKTKLGSAKRIKSPELSRSEPSSDQTNACSEAKIKEEKLSIKISKSLLYTEQNNSAEANVGHTPIKLRLPKIMMNEISPPSTDSKPLLTQAPPSEVLVTKSGRKRRRPKSLAGFVDSSDSSKLLYDSEDFLSETADLLSTCQVQEPDLTAIRKRFKVGQPPSSSPSPGTPISRRPISRLKVFSDAIPEDLDSEAFLGKCRQDSFYVYPAAGAPETEDVKDSDYPSSPITLKVRLAKQEECGPGSPSSDSAPNQSKPKKRIGTPKQRLGKLLKIDKSFIRR